MGYDSRVEIKDGAVNVYMDDEEKTFFSYPIWFGDFVKEDLQSDNPTFMDFVIGEDLHAPDKEGLTDPVLCKLCGWQESEDFNEFEQVFLHFKDTHPHHLLMMSLA